MTKTKFYFTAISEVSHALSQLSIPYELHAIYDGYQLTFPWMEGDVVIHSYSFGCAGGLFETMGFTDDEDDVRGYLTANEVFQDILNEYSMVMLHKFFPEGE